MLIDGGGKRKEVTVTSRNWSVLKMSLPSFPSENWTSDSAYVVARSINVLSEVAILTGFVGQSNHISGWALFAGCIYSKSLRLEFTHACLPGTAISCTGSKAKGFLDRASSEYVYTLWDWCFRCRGRRNVLAEHSLRPCNIEAASNGTGLQCTCFLGTFLGYMNNKAQG